MKVLIAYRSRYGATESCARAIAGKISGSTVVHDLRAHGRPAISDFDVVLVGGSIYGGKVQREIESFCDQERDRLLSKRVGLFLCCFYGGERGMAELHAAFPPWLTTHAFVHEVLGGTLTLRKLSLPDRILVRSLVHPARDISTIDSKAIERFAAAVNALRVA
ncbi:MAG TPA: flavodoxin domain-containing protein [Spirochaetia bacterium]|nr:flavodoxin domain-containing protein [Spirochaetia bacterium]